MVLLFKRSTVELTQGCIMITTQLRPYVYHNYVIAQENNEYFIYRNLNDGNYFAGILVSGAFVGGNTHTYLSYYYGDKHTLHTYLGPTETLMEALNNISYLDEKELNKRPV